MTLQSVIFELNFSISLYFQMNSETIIPYNKMNNSIIIWRITALWGFSESALGGILHAFKIPVTGLFVGSAAVIFITLIAYFSHETSDTLLRKGTILKATFTVLIIKGFVSPYTPVTAYFAVLLQGFMGEILFSSSKHFKQSTIFAWNFNSCYHQHYKR